MLGLLISLLGWGKTIAGAIWSFLGGVMSWAMKYPFQFISAVLLISNIWFIHEWEVTKGELETANNTIKAKQDFIDQQGARLKEYVKALDDEKKVLQVTIDTNNAAVANLKKAADTALANAQQAAAKAAKTTKAYQDLAKKYSVANPNSGTAEERIKREEATTDAFIGDWSKQ